MEQEVRQMRTIDLNRVAVFARVVDEGSFTKAALALGLPKSSVSRSVALLESELGTRLLQRSSRKLTVTEAGAAYYAQVAGALNAIDTASAAAAEQQSVPRGLVRITAPYDSGNDVFMPILARIVEQMPTISLEVALTNRHVDLAEEGFDLAIRAGAIQNESLIARKVADIRPGLFAARSYLKRRGTPNAISDLSDHECVFFRGERGRTVWTLRSGERVERVEVSGRLGVDDMGAVRNAMVLGVGIALLPPFACAREVSERTVVRVLPDWVGPTAQLSLVYPSARLVPQRVVLVRDYLLGELARIPWTCSEAPRTRRPAKGSPTTRQRRARLR
jgi:DNA-binding transcriptional LysR family regulator